MAAPSSGPAFRIHNSESRSFFSITSICIVCLFAQNTNALGFRWYVTFCVLRHISGTISSSFFLNSSCHRFAVLWIRYIFYHWLTEPDLALFVSGWQFFCILIFEGTFTSVFKDIKSERSHKMVEINFLPFCLWMEGFRSVQINDGSGFGRPKNILIWIHKTAAWSVFRPLLFCFNSQYCLLKSKILKLSYFGDGVNQISLDSSVQLQHTGARSQLRRP